MNNDIQNRVIPPTGVEPLMVMRENISSLDKTNSVAKRYEHTQSGNPGVTKLKSKKLV